MQYFQQTGFGGYTWLPRPGAVKEIQAAIKPLTLAMSAEDYLDLPELIINKVYVDLPPAARKVYTQMETILFALIDGDEVNSANAAVASQKCRQIANGGIYSDDNGEPLRKTVHVHDAKLEAVEEILEELQGKPALIGYEFNHDLERLRKRFGDHPFIGGDKGAIKLTDQSRVEAEWRAGAHPMIFGQHQSASLGLNLQGGSAVVFHSLTYNFEHYDQLIRRVWRQGQTSRVVVHLIIARDTVDEAIVATVESKGKTGRDLVSALRRYRQRR
jgi:SNF2 family DNA or RNA helicase